MLILHPLIAAAAVVRCAATLLCDRAAQSLSLSECAGDVPWPHVLLLLPGLRLSCVTAPLS
jgi:uncharacterized membrane protein YjjP (DUF1212 family)